MKKILMRSTSAGPSGVYPAGKVVLVPDSEAAAFLAGGYASEIKPLAAKVVEEAVLEVPETAVVNRSSRSTKK